jgi:hypothetical protein
MIFAVACGTDEDTTQKPEVTIGELEFEMVDVNSTDF